MGLRRTNIMLEEADLIIADHLAEEIAKEAEWGGPSRSAVLRKAIEVGLRTMCDAHGIDYDAYFEDD